MNRKRFVGVVVAGSLTALGAAGTALASGSDDARPRPTVSASARAELSISRAAAEGIAVRAAGGGTVDSVEWEVEHGRAVWDVDVLRAGVEHDIDVDAVSGVVLRHRIGGGGGEVSSTAATQSGRAGADDHGREAEPGDDRGRAAEPGDDRGGAAEPGDDRGGAAEPGDDRNRQAEPGDDSGRGREAGDDHGQGGHGSDD